MNHYHFQMVDVGEKLMEVCCTHLHMAGPYSKETLHLPENTPIPGTEEFGPDPCVFVADEAFLLSGDILRLYAGQRTSSTSGFPMPGT